MKIKNILAFVIACVIIVTPFSASADEKITVNGESVKVGDTVTFEYYLGGVDDTLEAAGAMIEYDPKALEYVEGSLGFDVFGKAIYNIENGMIYYSALDVLSGFDVKDEKLLVRAEFKVKDGAKGDQEIKHSFTEIFTFENEDTDLTPDDYKDRTVTAVNAAEPEKEYNPGFDADYVEELQQSSDTDFYEFMLGTDEEELMSEIEKQQSENVDQTAPANTENADTAFDLSDTVSLNISWEDVTDTAAAQPTASSPASAGSETEEKDTSGAMVGVVAAVFVLLVIGAAVFAALSKKKGNS